MPTCTRFGAREGGFDPDGQFYDAVIPNYLNPADYPFQPDGGQGDYYLYLGRLIKRKGIHIAVETCKRLGAKLKIAGQGCIKVEGNRIHCADGEVYEGDNLEYVGFATGAKRAALYQNAIATFVPTTYIEPFGAVAIESQMAGTPAITTDFGAFPETVEHGKTGFRCHTLDHFLFAARNAPAWTGVHASAGGGQLQHGPRAVEVPGVFPDAHRPVGARLVHGAEPNPA